MSTPEGRAGCRRHGGDRRRNGGYRVGDRGAVGHGGGDERGGKDFQSALSLSMLSDEEPLKRPIGSPPRKVRISNMLNGIDEVAPEDVDPHNRRLGKMVLSRGIALRTARFLKESTRLTGRSTTPPTQPPQPGPVATRGRPEGSLPGWIKTPGW